ncbi:MAG: polyamine aminopropyltransferase [Dehalococcoidales bacterium]|nr:polyamine aminopropyltransferase [Dehalococcoidales bacterium]
MEADPAKWFHDRISEDLIQLHSIKEVLYRGQTKFQSIEIIRTGSYGKCLVLDDKIQSSELDEFIYHEALIHPALTIHQNPETVFIAGGGEGATLREILRYNTVKKVVMVDIDEEVISICKEYLPEHHQGSFEDERIELYHTDARQYLADCKEAFDIIIIDLTEPIEEGPAYLLYTKEFYRIVQDKLTENGIMSVQSGCAAFNELLNFSAVFNTLKSAFSEVHPYQVDIPSFGGPWGFCFASNSVKPVMSTEEIDGRLIERGVTNLRLYDGITHQNMFALPKHLRKVLESQTRLITDDQPLYTYSG